MTLACKDIGIRKSEFQAKTQFFCFCIRYSFFPRFQNILDKIYKFIGGFSNILKDLLNRQHFNSSRQCKFTNLLQLKNCIIFNFQVSESRSEKYDKKDELLKYTGKKSINFFCSLLIGLSQLSHENIPNIFFV